MLDLYAQQVLALDPVGFWISALVALAAAFGITRHGLRSFWKLRLIVDTPTARIRSAAQGYVELTGIAHPHRELVAAPLTGTPCVWYRYEIEERRGSGRNASWVTVERGDAGTPFQIDDGTGRCLVEPNGAALRCRDKQVWYGHVGLLGQLGAQHRQRKTEERICDGEPVYVLGHLETPRRGARERQALTRHLLAQWKRDPQRMRAFDRDGDGQVDLHEWDAARAKAERLAERAEGRLSAEPPLPRVRDAGDARQPFVISTEDERSLLARLRLHAYGSAAGGLVLWVGLVYALLVRAAG